MSKRKFLKSSEGPWWGRDAVSDLPNGHVFSCELEKYLWLVNHEFSDEGARYWWVGRDFAEKGRCWDRVVWELKYAAKGGTR